jgi:hypothetical protein
MAQAQQEVETDEDTDKESIEPEQGKKKLRKG